MQLDFETLVRTQPSLWEKLLGRLYLVQGGRQATNKSTMGKSEIAIKLMLAWLMSLIENKKENFFLLVLEPLGQRKEKRESLSEL